MKCTPVVVAIAFALLPFASCNCGVDGDITFEGEGEGAPDAGEPDPDAVGLDESRDHLHLEHGSDYGVVTLRVADLQHQTRLQPPHSRC